MKFQDRIRKRNDFNRFRRYIWPFMNFDFPRKNPRNAGIPCKKAKISGKPGTGRDSRSIPRD